jgi:DNA-binding transcriptional LysR family regulator
MKDFSDEVTQVRDHRNSIDDLSDRVVTEMPIIASFNSPILRLMGNRLVGIDVFVEVVDSGSFSRAAQRLGLTRSAVAKSIARLEQRLDTRLFQRTTRSQTLTEDGLAFHERCVRALGELTAAEASLRTGKHEPSGALRVAAPVLFGRHCVAPLLVDLVGRHSRLSLDMTFGDLVVDLVGEGIDLAVRIGELPDSSSLASRQLGVQRMAIWAAPSYLARHGRPTDLAALADHVGILYGRADRDFPWRVRDEDGRARDVRVGSRLRLDDLEAIVEAARSGAGLAWLPCWLVARLTRDKELELVLGGDQVLGTPVHAVWAHTRYLPAKTRAAIDALAAGVPALMQG